MKKSSFVLGFFLLLVAFGCGWLIATNSTVTTITNKVITNRSAVTTNVSAYQFDFQDKHIQVDLPANIVASFEGIGEGSGSHHFLRTTNNTRVFNDTGVKITTDPSAGTNDDRFKELTQQQTESPGVDVGNLQRIKINGIEWLEYETGGICGGKTAETLGTDYSVSMVNDCGDGDLFEQVLKTASIK